MLFFSKAFLVSVSGVAGKVFKVFGFGLVFKVAPRKRCYKVFKVLGWGLVFKVITCCFSGA